MSIIYLLLGSNLGNRKKNLEHARIKISQQIGEILILSSVFETEPWGFEEETRNFYNQGIQVRTTLPPNVVLDKILDIENEMGRVRKEKTYEARIIDIDILFYNHEIIDDERLTIPHPGIPDRRFTLEILNEIAPTLVHPKLGKDIKYLLEECADHKKAWTLK